ncbi:hypothetical protein KPL70_003669 [Citrus sinensis]|nr:hypothetical protein KPL70_003669 [Citrus sinensis]
MTTNKECIERVETELREMQDNMQHMELGINNKLAHIKEILSKLAQSFNTSKDAPRINNNIATSQPNREDNEDCEDFDEALSRVNQTGTLRDYQKEFERLGNRVQGWTQKAFVGTFMDGLIPEISEEI